MNCILFASQSKPPFPSVFLGPLPFLLSSPILDSLHFSRRNAFTSTIFTPLFFPLWTAPLSHPSSLPPGLPHSLFLIVFTSLMQLTFFLSFASRALPRCFPLSCFHISLFSPSPLSCQSLFTLPSASFSFFCFHSLFSLSFFYCILLPFAFTYLPLHSPFSLAFTFSLSLIYSFLFSFTLFLLIFLGFISLHIYSFFPLPFPFLILPFSLSCTPFSFLFSSLDSLCSPHFPLFLNLCPLSSFPFLSFSFLFSFPCLLLTLSLPFIFLYYIFIHCFLSVPLRLPLLVVFSLMSIICPLF